MSNIKIPEFSYTVQYYTMQCSDRDKLGEFLAKSSISTSVHFKPLFETTYWKKGHKRDLPVAETVWKKLLSLPVHNALTNDQLHYIVSKVRECSNTMG